MVCSPVYTIADIFGDPHFRAQEMIVSMHDDELGEIAAPGITPKLSDTPGAAATAGSWELGRANREIYAERLGIEQTELDRLAEEGVI